MADAPDDLEETAHSFQGRYRIEEVAGQEVLSGEGTYGRVYKAWCLRTGRWVALKKMKLDGEEEGIPSTAIREVAVLRKLDHPNVVKLLDVCCTTRKMILALEFVDNDLKKYMRTRPNRQLDPVTIKSLGFQLCRGIEFCHANGVLHRDLKPQNLLIDSSDRLKIADFGLARAFTLPVPEYTCEVVTLWYRPIDILLGSTHYSVPVDMWSVGCILAEMATGRPLFEGESSEIGTMFKIFQKLGTPTAAAWPGLRDMPEFKSTFPKWKAKGWDNIRNTTAQLGPVGVDLLEQFMVYDPVTRLSAQRALQHPYFADVELPANEA